MPKLAIAQAHARRICNAAYHAQLRTAHKPHAEAYPHVLRVARYHANFVPAYLMRITRELADDMANSARFHPCAYDAVWNAFSES